MVRRWSHPLSFLACIAAGTMLLAQFQVNNQVELRVDNSLFGAGSAPPIRYSRPTSVMMPSEVRNAYWKSGALPSEWRMNAEAVGPLAPGGAAAYIPPKPAWTQVHVDAARYSPPPQSAAAYAAGTIRHANLPPSPNQVLLQSFDPTIRTAMPSSNLTELFSSSVPAGEWKTTPAAPWPSSGVTSTPGIQPSSSTKPSANTMYTPPRLSGSVRYPGGF